jgi:hypothetical protein
MYPIKTYADILWKWKQIPLRTNDIIIVISNELLAASMSIMKKQAGICTAIDDILV